MAARIGWEGVFPAVTTQFRDDLSLDIEATARVIDALVRDGVSGLIVCGTVGENTSLSRHEKVAVMEAAKGVARGRVPGSLARRAVLRYRALSTDADTHPYYGRVVRTATWTALQYWFFYAFNDWRSGFNGANDHEADWEQVLVYLDSLRFVMAESGQLLQGVVRGFGDDEAD